MTASKTCLICHTPFLGRADKRFCSDSCRAAFHNSKQDVRHALISRVNQQLLINHKTLLSFLNDDPFPVIDKQALLQKGFDAQYHTSRRVISGKVYYFCYDVGYTVVNPEQVMLRLLHSYSLGHEKNSEVEEEIVEYGF
jgi:predicted nucleic acid-binding Zn ribbon protein